MICLPAKSRCHFSASVRTANWSKTLLIFPLVLAFLIACDPDTAIYVTVDNKMPPTFSFSGKWWAVDFKVAELPPNSQKDTLVKVKTLWQISYPKGILRAKRWPKVTYGLVPEGFVQKIPARGSPPALVEGKIYVAQALDTSESGGSCFFLIKDGKPIEATEADYAKTESTPESAEPKSASPE
jgi:hypothetical protein